MSTESAIEGSKYLSETIPDISRSNAMKSEFFTVWSTLFSTADKFNLVINIYTKNNIIIVAV